MAFVSPKRKGMEWCFSKDNIYQIVPEEEELTYGFTPPDLLLQQIVCRPQSYASLDKYSVGESQTAIDELSLNMQGFSYGHETVNQFPTVDCGDEILEGLAPKKTGLLGDVLEQLDGAAAINRVDDRFLCNKPAQPISMHLDSQTAFNSHLACQSILFDQSDEARSNESTSMIGSGRNKCSSNLEVPSVCHEEMGNMEEERNLEGMLLQDLELVIRQMTRDTRVCVRDALYRLAKRSSDNVLSFDGYGEIMDVPALSSINPYETLRFGGMHHFEPETNAIDRTIANLMFTEVSCEQADMSCLTS